MNGIRRISILVIAVVVAAACSAVSSGATGHARATQSPVAFLERVVASLVANDYGTAWQGLHPLHQAVADEAEYVACEQLSPVPGRLDSVTPIAMRRKAVAVAGLVRRVRGVVVTFRLHLSDTASGATSSFTVKAATVRVGGRWAWMLPRERYELYKADACGSL
jgi:hypothetical protein